MRKQLTPKSELQSELKNNEFQGKEYPEPKLIIIEDGKPCPDILKTPTEPVTPDNCPNKEWFKQFNQLLLESGGLGLSANQVGIPLRIMSIRVGDHVFTMINPARAKEYFKFFTTHREQCLSLPGKHKMVKRYLKQRAIFYSLDGVISQVLLKDLEAIVFQHELEHLDGIEPTGYVDMKAQRDARLEELEKGIKESEDKIKELESSKTE